MANLTGVKTLSMAQGKETKIEHNGMEYELVTDGTEKVGDIAAGSRFGFVRAYFEFSEIRDYKGKERGFFSDEHDDMDAMITYDVYRAKPYRKIDKEDAEEGHFIKFNRSPAEFFTEGHYYEIVSIDGFGDPEILDDDGDLLDIDLFDEDCEVFEKVEKPVKAVEENPKTGEIKAGSKVRVVAPFMAGDHYKKGDVLTVEEVEGKGSLIFAEGISRVIGVSEVELVTDSIEAGDKAKFILPEGEPSRYGRCGVSTGAIGTVKEVQDDKISVNFDEFCGGRFDFEADISELAKVDEEQSEQLKVGDTVKLDVTDGSPRYGWGQVSNGEVGVVVSEGTDIFTGKPDDTFNVDFPSQKNWTGLPSELTKVEKSEEAPTPRKFQEGDIVRVTEDHARSSRNKKGDIGVITDADGPSSLPFHVQVEARDTMSANGAWHEKGSLELIVAVENRADKQAKQ